jgi:hypothetical protein
MLQPSDSAPTHLREALEHIEVEQVPYWWNEGNWHIILEERIPCLAWPDGNFGLLAAAIMESLCRVPSGWGVPGVLRYLGGLSYTDICYLLLLQEESSAYRACEKTARCIMRDLSGSAGPKEQAIKPRWHVSPGVRDVVLGYRAGIIESMGEADRAVRIILDLKRGKQTRARAQHRTTLNYDSTRDGNPRGITSERIR